MKYVPQKVKSITVGLILRVLWSSYEKMHKVDDVVKREVEKALKCRETHVRKYFCESCKKYIYQKLGCNSRLCSSCGKRYTDQWSLSLSRAMFNVPHRHFVMSVPSMLWPFLKENRGLWKVYMDSAIETFDDYFPKLMRNRFLKVGIVVVLHPFGKDMKFYPHLHIIVTEGAFTGNGKFIPCKFIPALGFIKCWQFHVLGKLQKAGLPNQVATELYRKYPKGFYVWLHRKGRIESPRKVAKYLGRYVRHPAISNKRIVYFDGHTVKFYYTEWFQGSDARWIRKDRYVEMEAFEFVTALIQHIPKNQFKMIRYYGAYARRSKGKFAKCSSLSGIAFSKQVSLKWFEHRFVPKCPYCGGSLVFVGFETIPPPGDEFHWVIDDKDLVIWDIPEILQGR